MVHYIGLAHMLTILYYWGTKPKNRIMLRGKCLFFGQLLTLALGLASPVFGQEDSRPPTTPQIPELVAHAEKVYQATKAHYEAQPTNAEAAWQFGRACYDLGDFATNSTQREAIAKEGMA